MGNSLATSLTLLEREGGGGGLEEGPSPPPSGTCLSVFWDK